MKKIFLLKSSRNSRENLLKGEFKINEDTGAK
jgi:hypothetical protein